MFRFASIAALLWIGAACISASTTLDSGQSSVFGRIDLIARKPVTSSGGSYADPALRDVRFNDYDRVEFAVVYTDQPGPSVDARISIRASSFGLRLEPAYLAMTPIVALTADVFDATRASCFEAKMNEFVTKPFTKEVLRDVIERMFAERGGEPAGSGLDERGDSRDES